MKTWQTMFTASLILFLYSSGLLAQEPIVRNVQFTQRADKKVEVTYDLHGNAAQKYAVKLSLIKSGERSAIPVNAQMLTGNVGEAVSPGRNLRIMWNLPKDYPQGLAGDGFVFVVQVFEQKSGGSKWRWISGGVVVGGVAAYLILGKSPPPETGSIIIDIPGN